MKLLIFFRLKEFLVGENHIPEYERRQHSIEYDDDSGDSDDESDHTPQDWSQLSSGVSSPDPTPPSAASSPLYPQLRTQLRNDFDKRFHTTYN